MKDSKNPLQGRRPAALGLLLAALLASMLGANAAAAVTEVAANGFAVDEEVTVQATPQAAYDALLHDIGRWWNAKHTYSGDSANLTYNVGGYLHGGFEPIAPAVDAVLADQLERLKGYMGARKAP